MRMSAQTITLIPTFVGLRTSRCTQQHDAHQNGQKAIDQVPPGTGRLERAEVADQLKHTAEQHGEGEDEAQRGQRHGGVRKHVDGRDN